MPTVIDEDILTIVLSNFRKQEKVRSRNRQNIFQLAVVEYFCVSNEVT